MKVIFLLAAVSLAVTFPQHGTRLKSLFKPGVGAQNYLEPRIIGGFEAVPHSRPFQAFLEVYDETGWGWYCSGEVVSNNYLLTAGICGDQGATALVTLGAHDIFNSSETGQVTVTATNITIHPEYDAFLLTNDISSFKLDQPIEFNEYIQPAALPSQADAANTFEGEVATVSGWGFEEGWGNLSHVLKTLNSPIVPNSQCEAESNWTIPVTQICFSGSAGTGACNGDLGAPLTVFVNDVEVVVGIFSYTASSCETGYPSVFTRITSYLDFIASATDAVIT